MAGDPSPADVLQTWRADSLAVSGELTHGDSMGHRQTLSRGQVQHMSAGTGVLHPEHNLGDKTLRFLQIWILPDRNNYRPAYGDHHFEWSDRVNRLQAIAGPADGEAPIQTRIYASYLEPGRELSFQVKPGRQLYLVNIEGRLDVSGAELGPRDAIEVVEEDLTFKTSDGSHFLFVEMAKEARPLLTPIARRRADRPAPGSFSGDSPAERLAVIGPDGPGSATLVAGHDEAKRRPSPPRRTPGETIRLAGRRADGHVAGTRPVGIWGRSRTQPIERG